MAAAPAEIRKRRSKLAKPTREPSVAASVLKSRPLWRLSLWQWAAVSILLAACFLRVFELSAKVLHHDEGVNGMFMAYLYRTGYYHYDPANYHGPSLYYMGEITTTIGSIFLGKEGLNTFTIRLVTALFGVGVVWLMLCLRRQLGNFGSLAAAAMAMVSPGFVFFSRYFIHEILFIFFTLGTLVALLRYRDTRRPSYFMLAATSLALLGTTKETWIITVAVWLIAIPCTLLWMRMVNPELELAPMLAFEAPVQQQGNSRQAWTRNQLLLNAAVLFLAIWVVLYSSLFTNFPQGVLDSVRTYSYWFKTSGNANVYPWTKYLQWLFGWRGGGLSLRADAELPAMILGAVGIITALFQARNRFAVFTAFWSMGIFAAYCLIPYKTPWLLLSIVLPWIIMAGYGLEQIFSRWRQRALALVLLAPAILVGTVQAIDLSFHSYDDETQPYSYAHSRRDLLNLVNEIETIAAGNPAGKNIGITIMSPEHWPLPWYLRDYPNAGYWGKVVDTDQPIIIALENQKAEITQRFGNRYREISEHDLRPGNRLVLYLRKDLQP
ncbi:MAG TPA: flippase activity-associated protein Agl23 [Candidatus Angelobacter sp.]|nr:flippase activity-associated protein Agl23 [Candidatus Angelobacter sp.]